MQMNLNTRTAWRSAGAITVAGALVALAGCGSSGSTGQAPGTNGAAGLKVPTANLPVLKHIGKGEGQLNLIAWLGYLQPQWVKPFEKQTGCMIHATYPNTSDEFVTLMKNGGGGVWDMASSSGDADLRIIYAGDAHPVNMSLIPSWNQFFPAFKAPPFNTVNGVHYGVSLQWGPNVLLYSKKAFPTPPTSWSVVYSTKNAGKISIYDSPIYIADAALYLRVHQPSLGITDPYELTQPQFQAAVNLLKTQHPLVKQYWTSAPSQISAYANGDVTVGTSWPYQVGALTGQHVQIGAVIPSEGATGWADTWMLAARAPHPNCAYMWMRYISTPKVQAEQAVSYGETPDNSQACAYMNQIAKGSCAQYHANAPLAYFKTIWLWKTPVVTCDNGKPVCVPYTEWTAAWNTEIK
jgi:putative spermidine/putrescine transport system substrate-binding protein